MQNPFIQTVAGCVLAIAGVANVAVAQPPAPPASTASASTAASAAVSPVVANPTYISIPLEITVNRPAAEVWKRIGKYCDIGEWLQTTCTILSGNGEIGTIRSIGGEVLAVENMKILAEGGTLPPAPARGGAPQPAAPPK